MSLFAIPAKKPLAFFAGASLLLCAPVFYLSCRGATQVRVEIFTDASCEDLAKSPIPVAVVYVGKDGHAVESIAGRIDPAASSFKCDPVSGQNGGSVLNYLGSLYVTPAGDRDAQFAFSVVAGISGKNTSECGKPADPAQPNDPKRYEKCIVSRRALNFIENDSLRLPVFLSLDCTGVACGATTTCRKGECVDATIPDLDLCKTELGCGEDTLDAGGGTGGAGGGTGGAGGAGGEGGAGGGAPVDSPPCGYVAAGSDHTCVAKNNKTVWCWGSGLSNGAYLLGDMTAPNPSSMPFQVPGINNAVHISAKYFHNCAVLSDNTVSCWGWNSNGQIGSAPVNSGSSPSLIPELNNVRQAAVGRRHSCALTLDDKVYCWGDNTYALLGIPAGGPANPVPVPVSTLPPVRMVSACAYHTCAVTKDDALWCWGQNSYNQLGDGIASPSKEPFAVIPTGIRSVTTSAYSVATAGASTCALYNSGQVICWGSNENGQLGTGDLMPRSKASESVAVGGFSDIEEIVSGRYHVCARHKGGTVSCWGYNDYLQIGNTAAPPDMPTPTPQLVENLSDAEHLFAGGYHTCALRSNKQMVCWGSNFFGELGTGATMMNAATPVLGPDICGP